CASSGANFSPLSLTSAPPGPLSRLTNREAGSAPGTPPLPVVVVPVESVWFHGPRRPRGLSGPRSRSSPEGSVTSWPLLVGRPGIPVRLVPVRHLPPTVARSALNISLGDQLASL